MGVRKSNASGPASHVEHQTSQFVANFSGFHFALLFNAALPSCSKIVPAGGAGSPLPSSNLPRALWEALHGKTVLPKQSQYR